uniref:hypothetical protein n=1 Tax=Sulfobacillus thermotolerans TaxID=338644 RepID=UPI00155DCF69|nr:hypothetical protein [Sulfobacillus thermotolerans]
MRVRGRGRRRWVEDLRRRGGVGEDAGHNLIAVAALAAIVPELGRYVQQPELHQKPNGAFDGGDRNPEPRGNRAVQEIHVGVFALVREENPAHPFGVRRPVSLFHPTKK